MVRKYRALSTHLGTVNLRMFVQNDGRVGSKTRIGLVVLPQLAHRSDSRDSARNLSPVFKTLVHDLPIVTSTQPMPTQAEMIRYRSVDKEEPPCVTDRLEVPHSSLTLSSGLMRVLSSVVQPSASAVFDHRQNLTARCRVA